MSAADLLSAIAVVAALVGLLVLVTRIEPHWSSRDGHRFICRAQFVDERGTAHGRWHEYRFSIEVDGTIEARRRGLLGLPHRSRWRVVGRADGQLRSKLVYVLRSERNELLAIRLPESSRSIAVLDTLTDGTTGAHGDD